MAAAATGRWQAVLVRTAVGALVGLAAGLVLAVGVLIVGPSELIVCGSGHLGQRLAEDVSTGLGGGHVDGPSASRCSVPGDASWLAAGVVLAGAAVIGSALTRRPGS